MVLTTLLCTLAIGKFLAPTQASRNRMRYILAWLPETWISVNNTVLSWYQTPRWDIEIPGGLDRKWQLPGEQQPPVLGGYPGPATLFQSKTANFPIFHQEPVNLGAFSGHRLVGAGHAIHAPTTQGKNWLASPA